MITNSYNTMKRQTCLLLLLLFCCFGATQATVKPRYRTSAHTLPLPEAPSDAQAPRRIGSRETAALTSLGSPRVPVVLVQTPDVRFTSGLAAGSTCTTAAQADSVNRFYHLYCNGRGDGTRYTDAGSAAAIGEFYKDQSSGLFTPQFDVIGPITLPDSMRYYGKNSSYSKDINIQIFYGNAIKATADQQIDWMQYDNDSNGAVDMVFFIYAGEGENALDPDEVENAADYIWPKESAYGGTINGIKFGTYACCNETFQGKTDGIGVFVHELSHALGLPDFYDTKYVAYGLDYWDLMDSGCYCADGKKPCGYSAYELDFLGWRTLQVLDPSTPQHLTLQPLSKGGLGYKIVNVDEPNEYYIIENRQSDGWDTHIGRGTAKQRHHGLMVSHVDYVRYSWVNNTVNTDPNNQRLTIIPADGTLDSYMYVYTQTDYNAWLSSTAGDLFPGSLNVTSLEGERTKVYHTAESGNGLMNQPLFNITEHEDGSITLDYMSADASAIISPTLDSRAAANGTYTDDIFTLQGQRIGSRQQLQSLPAGIYILNGRKYIVR